MKFIGHRGFRARFAENTLPAFEAVCAHPRNGREVAGIELDIHLTADGRVAVMHEVRVRGEGGAMVSVGDLELDRLRELAGPTDHAYRIPELPEVLELVAHRTPLYLEVKAGSYDLARFTGVLVGLLEAYRPDGDLFFSSFSPAIIDHLIPATVQFGLQYGFIFETWEQWDALPHDVHDKVDTLHPDYRLFTATPGRMAELDRPVLFWAPSTVADVRATLNLPGADSIRAIIADDMDLAYSFPEP